MLIVSMLKKIILKKRIKAKMKKRRRRRAKLIFGLLLLALTPLAISIDPEKREWSIASLLLLIKRGPSAEEEGKRDTNVTVPGAGFVFGCWRSAINKMRAITKKRRDDDEIYEELADDEFDVEADINE